MVYVTRDEPFPHIYENADFSPETIKNSIKEGEMKTIQAIEDIRISYSIVFDDERKIEEEQLFAKMAIGKTN